jgi:iron complex outermembrane receptor protein
MASAQPVKWFNTSGNITLSRNRIQSYLEVVPDYDNYLFDSLQFTNSPVSFSPEVIAAWSGEAMILKNLYAGIQFKYTGKQFLDNTGSRSRILKDCHFINSYAKYRVKINHKYLLEFRLTVYNVGNRLYETNGYTYSYIYGGERITENFYYPQAGRHFVLNAGFSF